MAYEVKKICIHLILKYILRLNKQKLSHGNNKKVLEELLLLNIYRGFEVLHLNFKTMTCVLFGLDILRNLPNSETAHIQSKQCLI